MKLYHYTTEDGKKGIEQNGKIKQSTDMIKDCLLGKGVYLTSLSPTKNSKEAIALNNYGDPRKAKEGYVDWVIEVDIDEKVEKNPDGRDVYCLKGKDLVLKKGMHKIYKV